MHTGPRTIRSPTPYRARWASRVGLGALAGVGAVGMAAACISGHATPDGSGGADPLASARGNVEGGPSLRSAGPVALARCDDGSQAFLELDRTGSTHVLSGSFVSPEDGAPRGLVAEFHHAEGEGGGGGGVALVGLTGAVSRSQGGIHPSPGSVEALASVTLSGLDDPSDGGRVSFQYGRTLLELSGCRFNLTALGRVRGQEHAPLVAFLKR